MPRWRVGLVVMVTRDVTGDVRFWLDLFACFHFDVVRFLAVVGEVDKFVHQTLAANLKAETKK